MEAKLARKYASIVVVIVNIRLTTAMSTITPVRIAAPSSVLLKVVKERAYLRWRSWGISPRDFASDLGPLVLGGSLGLVHYYAYETKSRGVSLRR